MKTKHIILMVVALAGLGVFGYPLVSYWSAGFETLLLIATVIGLPLIGVLTWLSQQHNKKIVGQIKSGQKKVSRPLLLVFIGMIILFAAVMVFNSLPVPFFLAFVYATFAGGFAYWFFRIWLQLKAADEAENKEKT